MRNVDSRIHSLRFDCCIFLFYSLSAMTFATQSAQHASSLRRTTAVAFGGKRTYGSVCESRDLDENRMGDRVPFYGMLKMFAAAVGLASGLTPAQSAPFMIVGNDEKLLWDDQFKPLLSPSGRDSMLIVDLAD